MNTQSINTIFRAVFWSCVGVLGFLGYMIVTIYVLGDTP